MAQGTLRVGLVGAGTNTRLKHIPGFLAQPGVHIVAVANRRRESAQRVADEFGIARVYDGWPELIDADDVDAVCIGTWPSTHCEITLAALRRAKHVLCEARMASDAVEARRMLEASRQSPGQIVQLVPAPATLHVDATIADLVAGGEIGELCAVELKAARNGFADTASPLHWRQDASISGLNVLSLGIWYESLMRWLGPAHRVMAMSKVNVDRRQDVTGRWRDVTVPDHVDVLATFGGAIAHLRFSEVMGLAGSTEAWIFGTRGTVRFDASSGRLWIGMRGDAELEETIVDPERRTGWRVEEEFVNAIRGRERVTRTTFEDGVRYMEFTAAVAASAIEGRAIDVPGL